MPRFYLLLYLVIFAWVLNGCVSLPKEPENISSLKRELAQDPENLFIIGELADEYRDLWLRDKNINYESQAYNYYKKYLKKSPGHIGASLGYYTLSMKASIYYKRIRNKEDLFYIYKNIGVVKKMNVMPPSFIQIIIDLSNSNDSEDHNKIIKLGKKALKENINFIPTYLLLSQEYNLVGQTLLSDLMLKQAQKINPDHPQLLKEIAENAISNLQNAVCSDTPKLTIEDIIKLNKKALHQKPTDPDLNYNLSYAYSALGKNQLALFYAKKSVDLENNYLNAANLIDQYMLSFKFGLAEKTARELLSEKKREKEVWSILGLLYFQSEQWDKAFNAFKTSHEMGEKLTVYNTMRYFLSAKIIGELEQANEIIKNYSFSPDEADFEMALLNYYRDSINMDMLLTTGQSKCDETEAYFFIGMKAFANDDVKTARKYFQKVIDLKIYPFYQYNAAKYRMTH